MNTLSLEYHTPQLVEQGLAITLTQATTQGHCYDECDVCDDAHNNCPCSGVGGNCKADETF
jgi:hypothetical protein